MKGDIVFCVEDQPVEGLPIGSGMVTGLMVTSSDEHLECSGRGVNPTPQPGDGESETAQHGCELVAGDVLDQNEEVVA